MTMAESTPDTAEQAEAQDFLAFLAGVDKGRVVADLGTRLTELVASIETTGRGGTLALKLTVKPAGKNNSDAMMVAGEVLLKAPKAAPRESFFFPDANHHLVRTDPNQNELF